MSDYATVLRVVGYLPSLRPEQQTIELNLLRRFIARHPELQDSQVLNLIEQGNIDNLQRYLIALIGLSDRIVFQTEMASTAKMMLITPNIAESTESLQDASDPLSEGGADASAELNFADNLIEVDIGQDPIPVEQNQVLAEIEKDTVNQVNSDSNENSKDADKKTAPELPQMTFEAPSTQVVISEQEHNDAEVHEHLEQKSASDSEPSSEPQFDDHLREKLFRRFRGPNQQTSKFQRTSKKKLSRWEFWHANSGLLKLSELSWLDEDIIQNLQEVDIVTASDLILLSPSGYLKCPVQPITSDMPEEILTVRGAILQKYQVFYPMIRQYVVVLSGKNDSTIQCRWIGKPPRGWENWNIHQTIGIVGDVLMEDGFQIVDGEPVGVDGRGSGILPKYDIPNIEDRTLRDIIAQLIVEIFENVQDSLPKEVLDQVDVLSLADAIREAHFPSNQTYKGRERLAFEEVFLYHIGKRLNSKFKPVSGYSNPIIHQGIAHLSWMQNMVLNDSQEIVLSEIQRDLIAPVPMRRLLQGDVGSGKPMVAIFAALSILSPNLKSLNPNEIKPHWQKSKNQTVEPVVIYLCQDSLSAERRYLFAQNMFKALAIQCKLFTQKPSGADIHALEHSGGLVFLTIESLVPRLQAIGNIRLVIVEESANFGHNIPFDLLKKNASPDLLVFTPTPQSMDVLETIYADFALSTIQHSSVRIPSCSYLLPKFRNQAYEKMLLEIQKGRQGLIVLPVVNGKDLIGVAKALDMANVIQTQFLPEIRIGVYCSDMKAEERLNIFAAFQQQRLDVLLCTTVIEDTPIVGNVTMMIVEKADMCTEMRLHRLRGHLGHSHYAANCHFVLSSDTVEAESIQRVGKVCQEENGFELAESVQQTQEGLSYRWVSSEDRKLRLAARSQAHTLSLKDLKRSRWPLLQHAVKHWWNEFDMPEQQSVKKKYRKRRR